MKKFIGTGLLILLSFAFFGCGASKVKAQNKAPFKVLEATYANSVGEQPDLVETTLRITINNKDIQLDSVYFRNNSASLKRVENIENSLFIGSFTVSKTPYDLILHADPIEEFGNKPPVTVSKLPFEIKKNEAVVSYFIKDKINYYKILEVKEIVSKDGRPIPTAIGTEIFDRKTLLTARLLDIFGCTTKNLQIFGINQTNLFSDGIQ